VAISQLQRGELSLREWKVLRVKYTIIAFGLREIKSYFRSVIYISANILFI